MTRPALPRALCPGSHRQRVGSKFISKADIQPRKKRPCPRLVVSESDSGEPGWAGGVGNLSILLAGRDPPSALRSPAGLSWPGRTRASLCPWRCVVVADFGVRENACAFPVSLERGPPALRLGSFSLMSLRHVIDVVPPHLLWLLQTSDAAPGAKAGSIIKSVPLSPSSCHPEI